MKIRNGFVSNSSSTSFCLLGLCLGKNARKKAQEIIKDTQLRMERDCGGGDYIYVGMPPEAMKDEETLKEFKDRILKQICDKDPSFVNTKLEWITDGGYDG
jgi:hypothetical protein